MGISAVVPVYDSEGSLALLVQRCDVVLNKLGDCYELILVNDGSSDRSWETICDLALQYEWITGFDLMRNYGQHNALLCGIRAARYDLIVTLDDDLQHPPEEIPKLIEKLAEGYDVVYGKPYQQRHGFWRNFASRAVKAALRAAMGVESARDVSAFRAFRTRLRNAFSGYGSPVVSIDVMLSWGTKRFAAVQVREDPRVLGGSHYTFGKLLGHALNMVTGFSTWPLRLASLVGFCFTLFGLGVLAFVVGRYVVRGDSVPGFPFLASVIAIFSGAQLFALGIIGEYLSRMYFRMMERPPYAVRDVCGRETGIPRDVSQVVRSV